MMKPAATLAALVAAAIGSAQGLSNMDPFWFHCADVALLQAKEVQKSLGVTEPQRARMNTFAANHQARLTNLGKEYEKKKKTPADAQKDPRLVGYFLELKKNVMGQLSKTQLKRLGEISLQRLGMASLMDDKVGARVGLSKTQIGKLRTTFQDGGMRYAKLERTAAEPVLKKYKDKAPKDQKGAEALRKQFDTDMGAAMRKVAPQLGAIRQDTEKRMLAILSAKQKASYQALLGKPFRPG